MGCDGVVAPRIKDPKLKVGTGETPVGIGDPLSPFCPTVPMPGVSTNGDTGDRGVVDVAAAADGGVADAGVAAADVAAGGGRFEAAMTAAT